MKILVATKNKGKISEIKDIISKHKEMDIEIYPLNDFSEVDDAIENGTTFLENAYIKAIYYYNIFKMPVITDDSGLCVDALNGKPGVLSARYASSNSNNASSNDNIDKLLKELSGVTNRNAHFACAMYYYDGKLLCNAFGIMDGFIGYERVGNNGFGYDPIFISKVANQPLALLDNEEKNSISHRHIALEKLINEIKLLDKYHLSKDSR